MSPESVRRYLARIREHYRGALQRQRGALLDEVCALTCYHRKAARRAVAYGVAVVDALVPLWEASDRLCSKRLPAAGRAGARPAAPDGCPGAARRAVA